MVGLGSNLESFVRVVTKPSFVGAAFQEKAAAYQKRVRYVQNLSKPSHRKQGFHYGLHKIMFTNKTSPRESIDNAVKHFVRKSL
jgi:hypothetical protein